MKQTNEKITHQELKPVPFTSVSIEDTFWAPRLKSNTEVTVQLCLDHCESTGRIANFAKAAGLEEGEFEGIYFNDSDVYKLLEGAAYSLMTQPDAELEKRIDGIIENIAAAQEADGYLDTFYTLKAPDQKWTDMEKHEMYCGGHLIEAAVAYKQATGKRKLLGVACRLADHFDSLFGPGKRHWVEGHEEIELALVKLYRETGEERYWKLARWLLEERGHGHGVGMIWEKPDWGPSYCQDDKPVREITQVTGHAVRAMYLYTGMADVAAVNGDQGYIDALDRVWDSVVNRNMYITGGIGPSKHNEGFTMDYDLPNDTAYCETCASIGMVYWNHRMNLLHGDGKYADVVEKAMYNGVLSGVSLSGDKFFYVNPLSSNGSHHRVHWFDCSCCPTNIARFIPSVGNYVYAATEQGIYVNLYVAGTGTVPLKGENVHLTQATNYPWEGSVRIMLDMSACTGFELCLRYPGWCKSAKLSVNGIPVESMIADKGYIKLQREWKAGDSITIEFDMPVERVYAHPRVEANFGKVALQRGPLVYCLEQTDNPIELKKFTLSPQTKLTVEHVPELMDGVTVIKGINELESDCFTGIPYFSWDNREPGEMEVWLKEREVPDSLYRS